MVFIFMASGVDSQSTRQGQGRQGVFVTTCYDPLPAQVAAQQRPFLAACPDQRAPAFLRCGSAQT
ncbi:MAG: hypothetical protein HT579_07145 [Candidatus Accumulibacter similis]|nr:MAG: hypothetical protein HT579_07145 [Candidatus Accumulibacter similis]